MRNWRTKIVGACVIACLGVISLRADDSQIKLRRQYDNMVAKGRSFLLSKGRASDGSYSSFAGTGITSLVTTALLKHGASVNDPRVAESLTFLKTHVQKDGGIYQTGSLYRNYETCLAILCFSEANSDGEYDELLKRADAFVKGIQWEDGGAGYGKHKRPDLSNTAFLIEALQSTGNDADSEAIRRALEFVSTCQNLETEHNQTPFASKNPDGGFYYTPAAGGTSQAGTTSNGGLRSYASMTYAGLKSMIYAGVGPDDKRVKAAYTWIEKHYDLDSNPGMGSAGLYYYYHTFAKALDAMKIDEVEDDAGVKHNWRRELIEELAGRQQADGSWINGDTDRWLEGDENLVTGYALLALAYCKP